MRLIEREVRLREYLCFLAMLRIWLHLCVGGLLRMPHTPIWIYFYCAAPLSWYSLAAQPANRPYPEPVDTLHFLPYHSCFTNLIHNTKKSDLQPTHSDQLVVPFALDLHFALLHVSYPGIHCERLVCRQRSPTPK